MNKFTTIKPFLLTTSIAAVFLVSACQKSEPASSAASGLETLDQKVAYIKSYKLIKRGMANGVEFDLKVMERAIYDAKSGLPPMVPESEHMAVMKQMQKEFEDSKKQKRIEQGAINKKQGMEYLSQNAKKEGVHVTESGLQYRVLKAVEGDAAKPTGEDTVKAHYHGTLLDGTVFESSVDKGRPLSFALSNMIEGWNEAFQLMKVGEKYEFVVPSELAYGEKGTSGVIGINAVLKFELELLEINPGAESDK